MNYQKNSYGDSHSYEAFMTRAYRSTAHFSKGTDNGEFLLLEYIASGHARKGLTYEKQLRKLKNLLTKAIGKVLKWKLTIAERAAVIRFADMAEQADDADGLAIAINGLLEATHRLKAG